MTYEDMDELEKYIVLHLKHIAEGRSTQPIERQGMQIQALRELAVIAYSGRGQWSNEGT